MTDNEFPHVPKPPLEVGLPPPDSPGGLVVLFAIILGTAYVLLLVGAYSSLAAEAGWVVPLTLVLAVVVSFFLVSMVGSDRARATQFELEFALYGPGPPGRRRNAGRGESARRDPEGVRARRR